MFLRQAAGFLRRFRFPSPTVASCRQSATPSSVGLSGNLKFLWERGGSSVLREHHGDLALWITISGQAALILGISVSPAMAENVSGDELSTQYDNGEASLTGLRRIEDGSVISNEHTVKWRIFTDNGRDLFMKGKLDEAESYFLSALQEAKRGFGERDAHVASSCNNLAELYRVRKAFDKAEPLYLEAIDILKESFGPEDIRVGAALHNLGQFYLVQRNLEQARICYERALKIEGRILGHGHPDYANTMYHLGTVLNLQGKEKDAVALIQDSIRILEEGGLGETPKCIRRMRYLAQILLNSNRLQEAENLQRKILHIQELSKGWDSLDTLIAAEGLALTLQSVGNLREAQELLERCLDVRKTIFHENHVQIASNMLHLARVLVLNSNQLRKFNISEASAELDKATLLLDNSTRIARLALDNPKENRSKVLSNGDARGTKKDDRAAVHILLQSLEARALAEITKHELLESEDPSPMEAERALHQCISIFKEPGIPHSVLNSPDVKAEYLSCLKHLLSLLSGSTVGKTQQSRATLQELKDEIRVLESELSSNRKQRN